MFFFVGNNIEKEENDFVRELLKPHVNGFLHKLRICYEEKTS